MSSIFEIRCKKKNLNNNEEGFYMKAPIKAKSVLTCVAMVCAVSLVSLNANAEGRSFNYYSDGDNYTRGFMRQATATCTTLTSNKPLPTYVCCKLVERTGCHKWRTVWSGKWVSGSCASASPYARHDSSCDMNSPVITTGMPILGNCQFSTIKYEKLYKKYVKHWRHHHHYVGCGCSR